MQKNIGTKSSAKRGTLLKSGRKKSSRHSYGFDEFAFGLDFMMSQSHLPLRARRGLITPNALIFPDYTRIWGTKFSIRRYRESPKITERNLALFEDYKSNRRLLGQFQDKIFRPDDMPEDIVINAGKKLGVLSPNGKIDIYNEIEMNILCDYFVLYSYLNNKKYIVEFLDTNPSSVLEKEKEVMNAFVNSKFTILRFDEFLDSGVIKALDLFNGEECILIDQALNRSSFVGCHLVANLLILKDYVMTSGGSIPFDPESEGGKKTLAIFDEYIVKSKSKKSNEKMTDLTVEYVSKIYNYCLTTGALNGHAINQI